VTALSLSDLARSIASSTPTLGRSRLVCIDGPAGSGKTTLAGQLRDALQKRSGWQVQVLHMDDFYRGWTGLDDELTGRIEAQVLAALRRQLPARYQRYDWERAAFTEWHDVPVGPALILEGVGSGAIRFADSTTLLMWVEAPAEVRLARGVSRDGEPLREEWVRWMRLEAAFAATNRTRERADILLDGTPDRPLGAGQVRLLDATPRGPR
jgi:energy-coupling factor transporter ATP-binding protein EcfA2